ncbi:MAG: hypothetical protein SFX73_40060 [Kofleriaceae bacterium]|nr:hypothetical protein [Kofleriaceae bacterium]
MRSFVALALVSCLAAACGGRSAKAPKWPQMAERGEDGGESLAPRQPGVVESSADADIKATATSSADVTEAKPAEAANETRPTPTVSEPVMAPEEVINLDDIVIEVED